MIVHKGTYTVHFLDSDTERTVPTLQEAMGIAAAYVGNNSYAKISPNEHTYLYGPGDGTTSVMIREDVEFT